MTVNDSGVSFSAGSTTGTRADITAEGFTIVSGGSSAFNVQSSGGQTVLTVNGETGDITMASGASLSTSGTDGGIEFQSVDGSSTLTVENKEINLSVTNDNGNSHGLTIGQNSTTLSGGANSTQMILDDIGVKFSNMTTGAPVKVTGVADGEDDYDAVNVRQLNKVRKGVAMSMAMNTIPQNFVNGNTSFGFGTSHFDGFNALAVGFYHGEFNP